MQTGSVQTTSGQSLAGQSSSNTPSGMTAANSNLGRYHTVPLKERVPNRGARVFAGLVVILFLAACGLYLYSISASAPPPRVSAAQLPYTPPPPMTK